MGHRAHRARGIYSRDEGLTDATEPDNDRQDGPGSVAMAEIRFTYLVGEARAID